jgi:hypothetical protein
MHADLKIADIRHARNAEVRRTMIELYERGDPGRGVSRRDRVDVQLPRGEYEPEAET